MEVYLARPKLRSENHKTGTRAQLELHLKDWMRLPLDEISKAMVVRRHQEMSGSPLAANHVLRNFRAIYNHARQTCDLAECPTMAIERFEDKPDGRIIDDLKDWRQTIDGLLNPIHLSITKNGWSFDFPILQLHHEILAPLRPLSKEWVFPSPKSETGHITRPERLKYNPHIHR